MDPTAEYDNLAEVYDEWVEADAAAEPARRFYSELFKSESGIVVELGIGTGRNALPAALLGTTVIGIDLSQRMLAECKRKAEAAGVGERLDLRLSDARTFALEEPASLIALPLRGIGHFRAWDDKLALLRNVRRNLRPGGCFVFDHDVLDDATISERHGLSKLWTIVAHEGGSRTLIWQTICYTPILQWMDLLLTLERVDARGTTTSRRHQTVTFGWLTPVQAHELLERADFEVETAYGDFDRAPLTNTSRYQVWVARRPEGV